MTNATAAADHRLLPRKKRAPSARDQAILVAYRTQGRTQTELALDHHLSQRRISQIVQRVEHWLANVTPADGDPDPGERLRLDRRMERQRAQSIYDRALRAFDDAPRELTTVRHEQRPGGELHVETKRQIAPSAQFLNVALRAHGDLTNAADKPAPPPPKQPAELHEEHERITRHFLCVERKQAENARQVAKSDDYVDTVELWMDALVGKRDCVDAANLSPGSPLAELSRFFIRAPQTESNPEFPSTNSSSNASNLSNPSPPSNFSHLSTPSSPDESPSDSAPLNPVPRTLNPPPDPDQQAWQEKLARFRQRIRGSAQDSGASRHEASEGVPATWNLKLETLNSPLYPQINDFGYQPIPPPTPEEDAQMVQDHLAKIRAQYTAIQSASE